MQLLLFSRRRACAEFLDTTCGVDGFGLSGVKGVRSGRDFDMEKRIFLAVIPCAFCFRLNSRVYEKMRSGAGVFEYDRAVFRRMNVFLHGDTIPPHQLFCNLFSHIHTLTEKLVWRYAPKPLHCKL